MDSKKYVFVGNREYVLREMIRMGLNIVGVYVMQNSFLHRRLEEEKFIEFTPISKKSQLLELLAQVPFDVLISNGCKYILPIDNMKDATYINIHPSHLPDLKGMDPINGACLFNRTAGAACHIIDAGIDTGKIVSRVAIPMTEDIDAVLLFQLCFKAEVMAFKQAYESSFRPMVEQPILDDPMYYSIKDNDLLVDFKSGVDLILRQAKAFGYASKGLYFKANDVVYKFFGASEIVNPFVLDLAKTKQEREVFISYDNSIVIKLGNRVLRFSQIDKRNGGIFEGSILEECTIDEMHVFEAKS